MGAEPFECLSARGDAQRFFYPNGSLFACYCFLFFFVFCFFCFCCCAPALVCWAIFDGYVYFIYLCLIQGFSGIRV